MLWDGIMVFCPFWYHQTRQIRGAAESRGEMLDTAADLTKCWREQKFMKETESEWIMDIYIRVLHT